MIALILRFLKPQGIVGLAASSVFAILLAIELGEARHYKKQSAGFEQLYQQEKAALATTVANYRQAAAAAEASDNANAHRVADQQNSINQRTSNDFEARLAAARARADRLRLQPEAADHPGAGADASMPAVPVATVGPAEGTLEDRLPPRDALTATEQAIQLDELIKWVRAQAAVNPNDKKN